MTERDVGVEPWKDFDKVEKFGPTSGRLVGGLGIAACVATAIGTIGDGRHDTDAFVLVCLGLVGLLIWMVMFRPSVRSDGTRLHLRSMVTTTSVPLASIQKVDVGAMLLVKADDHIYRSIAVGRPRKRQRAEEGSSFVGAKGGSHQHSYLQGTPRLDPSKVYSDFVETRIKHLAQEAQAHKRGYDGVGADGKPVPAPVTRSWAWPELAGLVVLSVVAVVLLLA